MYPTGLGKARILTDIYAPESPRPQLIDYLIQEFNVPLLRCSAEFLQRNFLRRLKSVGNFVVLREFTQVDSAEATLSQFHLPVIRHCNDLVVIVSPHFFIRAASNVRTCSLNVTIDPA